MDRDPPSPSGSVVVIHWQLCQCGYKSITQSLPTCLWSKKTLGQCCKALHTQKLQIQQQVLKLRCKGWSWHRASTSLSRNWLLKLNDAAWWPYKPQFRRLWAFPVSAVVQRHCYVPHKFTIFFFCLKNLFILSVTVNHCQPKLELRYQKEDKESSSDVQALFLSVSPLPFKINQG